MQNKSAGLEDWSEAEPSFTKLSPAVELCSIPFKSRPHKSQRILMFGCANL